MDDEYRIIIRIKKVIAPNKLLILSDSVLWNRSLTFNHPGLISVEALKEYIAWFDTAEERIKMLISEISVTIFLRGMVNLNHYQGNWKGYRSRLINKEHRLVYKIFDTHILVIKYKRHYKF